MSDPARTMSAALQRKEAHRLIRRYKGGTAGSDVLDRFELRQKATTANSCARGTSKCRATGTTGKRADCDDCPNPGGPWVVSLVVGLLTHRHCRPKPSHPPGRAMALPESKEGAAGCDAEGIACGIQRPDRPGIAPEFPVSRCPPNGHLSPRAIGIVMGRGGRVNTASVAIAPSAFLPDGPRGAC